MRSDTYPDAPNRTLTPSHSAGTAIARMASPSGSDTSSRAFPPSSAREALPDASHRAISPAPVGGSVGAGGLVRAGPPAPLPPSLFTPPTSAADLTAKLELAQRTLRALDAHARLADLQTDFVQRSAEKKEAEQEKELAVLRRELEAAKRSAVEMQLKASATQKSVTRSACRR